MVNSVPNTTITAEYYHKVVDCQYACPAHTPVPEYIRLIAQGEYTKAYMVNRKSNVFPGILGRVCDRPCEPACRRGRLEEEPVAICRLKRVAGDFKDKDIRNLLPAIPATKNGKRIALIGGGPASFTVANDLMPLGYECVLFEKEKNPGGAMRFQVPGFRLPESILDEELGYIVGMGLTCRFGQEVTSLSSLLSEGFDAVFVGVGAPVGRDLPIPGRKEAGAKIHVGLTFLANVAFGHQKTIGKKVVIIGGGNTAMDCCRTALRLGGQEVSVVAPETYAQMLASPWEKEDAEREGVKMRNDLLPKEFVVENGILRGVRFTHLTSCYTDGQWNPQASGQEDVTIPCDEVVLAIGQNVNLPFIDQECGVSFVKDTNRVQVDNVSMQSTNPKVFFGGDAAFGPKNIIWAVAHGHEAAISIHLAMQGQDPIKDRQPVSMSLKSQKMTLNQWSYDNSFDPVKRQLVPHQPLEASLRDLKIEVEMGFDVKLAITEAKRCLNCDVETVFQKDLCIECDACVDICPVACLSMTASLSTEDDLRRSLPVPALNTKQGLYVSALPQTPRLMVKDENVCLHCGLCAERCPTGAWDMQEFNLKLGHLSL